MNAPFGHYLRIKPQDDKLIFLFAKVRKGSLIQSIYGRIKIFLSATFTLYSIKCAILDHAGGLFLKILPPGQPGIPKK